MVTQRPLETPCVSWRGSAWSSRLLPGCPAPLRCSFVCEALKDPPVFAQACPFTKACSRASDPPPPQKPAAACNKSVPRHKLQWSLKTEISEGLCLTPGAPWKSGGTPQHRPKARPTERGTESPVACEAQGAEPSPGPPFAFVCLQVEHLVLPWHRAPND